MLLEAPSTKTSQIFHFLAGSPRRGSWSKNNQTPQCKPTAPSVCREQRCSRTPCPSSSQTIPPCSESTLCAAGHSPPSHNRTNLLFINERSFSERIKQRNWRLAINSSTSFQSFRSDQSLQDYNDYFFFPPAVLQKTINFSSALGNIHPINGTFWHCQCTWHI